MIDLQKIRQDALQMNDPGHRGTILNLVDELRRSTKEIYELSAKDQKSQALCKEIICMCADGLRALHSHAELLAACKAAVPAVAWGATHSDGNHAQYVEVMSKLNAAIAKAEGRVPAQT